MTEATMVLAAYEPEFEFETAGHAAGELAVLRFKADEELSRPFSVEVTLVPRPDVEVAPASLIGGSALLTLQLGEGAARFVHGMVAEVHSWEEGTGDHKRRYRVRVVPALWALGHVRRSRIFQSMSVPDIVKKILGERRIEQRASLRASYPPRLYCVQYDESDLDFVSRLLEEEGIFYFFEHEQTKHTLVLGDAPDSCPPVAGEERILFRERSGMAPGAEHFDAFSARVEVCPGKVALRDYNELTPALDLTATSAAASGTDLEVYLFPGRYADGTTGKARAKVRLQEERVRADTASGSGFSRRLLPGHVFELDEHPLAALNAKYLVCSVHHRGEQSELLLSTGGLDDDGGDDADVHDAADDDADDRDDDADDAVEREGEGYRCDFTCLRRELAFRPERRTPRPVIAGPQTAIVVGPAGEEIHCDEHGRIKVQFHWDREGKKDEHSSCWIRVGQSWAGPGWGSLYLPRIGQEVVVEFLEGDPDRPLVTGAVYNGANLPPVSLPGEKTRSTIRSASSPGSAGFNELRFEDEKGHEEIYFHAQKDLDIVVEHDKTQRIGHDEKLTVGADRAREVQGNQTLHVAKNDSSTIDGNQTLTVAKDRAVTVSGSHHEKVSGGQSISVGGAYSLTVGALSSEKVGGAKSIKVKGAFSLSVGAAMIEKVGGAKTDDVGGAKSESVAGSKKETIGGGRTMEIEGDYSESVGGKRSIKIGEDFLVDVEGELTQTATEAWSLKAKEITLTADERVLIKVGSATLEMKKDGTVVIKGGKIELKASDSIVEKSAIVEAN